MGTEYNGGTQVISQPNFFRELDVSGADFDGTATAAIADSLKTQEANNSKFNPWKKNGGFVVKPATTGTIDVLSWEDYRRNGKVIDDALMQTIPGVGGTYNEERVIKVYDSSAITDLTIGTII